MMFMRHRPSFVASALALLVLIGLLAAPVAGAGAKKGEMGESGAKPDAKIAERSKLILGLNGVAYKPYKTSVIEWVQQELKDLDMYEGEVDGRLDEPTKKAIAEFQKENELVPTGIPTPLTRKALRKRGGGAGNEGPGSRES